MKDFEDILGGFIDTIKGRCPELHPKDILDATKELAIATVATLAAPVAPAAPAAEAPATVINYFNNSFNTENAKATSTSKSTPKSKPVEVEVVEELENPIPDVLYDTSICIRGQKQCSVSNGIYKYKRVLQGEILNEKPEIPLLEAQIAASMVCWSIPSSMSPDSDAFLTGGSRLKAIQENLLWRAKTPEQQLKAYLLIEQLECMSKFRDVGLLEPLKETFGKQAEEAKEAQKVVEETTAMDSPLLRALVDKFHDIGITPRHLDPFGEWKHVGLERRIERVVEARGLKQGRWGPRDSDGEIAEVLKESQPLFALHKVKHLEVLERLKKQDKPQLGYYVPQALQEAGGEALAEYLRNAYPDPQAPYEESYLVRAILQVLQYCHPSFTLEQLLPDPERPNESLNERAHRLAREMREKNFNVDRQVYNRCSSIGNCINRYISDQGGVHKARWGAYLHHGGDFLKEDWVM